MKKFAFAAGFLLVLVGLLLWLSPERGAEKLPEVVDPKAGKPAPRQAWELAGVPDFTAPADVKQKKARFFNYLLPLVREQNQKVAAQRARLKQLQMQTEWSADDRAWMSALGRRYKVRGEPGQQWFEQMLLKVDRLPVSLVLAQAANESGWGTSRFAREGNNYFGQWCFTKGCGLVPGSRSQGAIHEVQKFADVSASVKAYLLNLNSHSQYRALRELRANARQNSMAVTGAYLAQGLGKYSERGYEYVDEIVAMINSNQLQRYDQQVVADNKAL